MKRTITLAILLCGVFAFAQIDEPAQPTLRLIWSVDFTAVKQWLYTDQSNVQRLMDWMDASLTQTQLDSLESTIGTATAEQKKEAFKEIQAQLIKIGISESDAKEKAILDALTAVTAEVTAIEDAK
jgi:hypothetical protein